ncbi:MAG TPA: DUF3857 domain-containing protein [Bacteroidales bacterium]|nr:DUF3857 domain-containing protein [Bacteroidales bacterium]
MYGLIKFIKNAAIFLLLATGISYPAFPQRSGKIIDYTTKVKFTGKSLVEEKSFLIMVEDRQSDWLSDIRIPYNKSSKIEILDAYVMGENGSKTRKFQKKDIVTLSDISENTFYEDDMTKEFSLRNSEYPYYIFYSYRKTTERYVYIAAWSPLLASWASAGKATLEVEIPNDVKVKISSQGEMKFSKDSTADTYIFRWEASGVHPYRKEILAPPDKELMPHVYVIPESFIYGIPGRLDSWSSMGKWQDEMNNGLDELPLSEEIKVTSLLSGITDRKEIIRKLYHYMQDNTHYVNVVLDIGGFKPYPASYVCNNKYGDCKALTMYMKALLRFAGVDSYYTLIYGGDNPVNIKSDLPSFQFNHVILCVPGNNDTTWLENTSQYAPCGYLGTFTQNRYALVVNGNASRLVRTPAMAREDFLVKSVLLVKAIPYGDATIHLEEEIRGDDFESWLACSSELQEDKLKMAFSNELPLKNEVIRHEISHPDREARSVKITGDYKSAYSFREIGNSLVLNSVPLDIFTLEKPDQRKLPLRISFPVNILDSIKYEMPYIGNYLAEIPSGVSITSKYGSYKADFVREGESVTLVRSLFIEQGNYSRNEYEAFYSFIESVKKSVKNSVIILNKK